MRALLFAPLLLCSCLLPRGAPDGIATSLPTRCAQVLTLQRRALAKCQRERTAIGEECLHASEAARSSCLRGVRSVRVSLDLCRKERDSALGRKCPACKGAPVWPVVAGVVVGVVVGAGVGVVVGALVR